jgi:topoisomerase-4 subunit B
MVYVGTKVVYDESKIKTLSSLEHIRLRTGMYIGRLGDGSSPDDGIYVLLKEVIDNSVDEFIMGAGERIIVRIEGSRVSVRDYGRGIPLGKVIDCVSTINTGAKYNDDVFQFSVGLNGVGTKAVNALSREFRVVSYRDGRFFEARFERGVLKDSREGGTREKPGTLVEFVPDEAIFGEYAFNFEFLEKRLWNYACLNPGLVLSLNGKEFKADKGLFDLLSTELGTSALYDIGWYRGERIEFAFTHTREYGEEHFSFVNGQHTSDGGTHLSAFREGFLKAVNEFYQASYKGEDVREGLAAAIAIRIKNPIFESQTKNKLGNADIRPWILQEVKKGVDEILRRNPQAAKALQEKILTNEKLRTELNIVRKEAKEAARKIELKIPNLKDCKLHLGDGAGGERSTLFITEGQSAAGSMVSARDVHTQAIFSLRGKPENMFGRPRSAIYKNEELYNLMQALGIEHSVENLRYARIVIATDADYDGFHIRNLLLTFFLTFFEELVVQGRVYILETPLFRVRTKKETRYCYSAKERDEAVKALGAGAEVTRFKGLGEISPAEFGQFIGPDIRLVRVDIQTLSSVPELLEFFMGKNTPDRRGFIMENLVTEL